MSAPRIHQVSCSIVSGPEGTASFEEADRLCGLLAALAKRRGFGVLHENVDEHEGDDVLSDVVAHLDAAETPGDAATDEGDGS